MNIELSKQEAWKLLDVLECYQKDYSVSTASNKTIENVKKKLKKVANSEKESTK